jgi:hypothetical protein
MVTSKKVANVHKQTSIDGWHKRLGHHSFKIVYHFVKNFPFLFPQPKFYLHYAIYVILIKHINNPFMSILSKVMRHLNLFTQICGVLLVILELMDHDIT